MADESSSYSDSAELFSSIGNFIDCFVALSQEEVTVIVLWLAHCHTFEVADATPYLSVTSSQKRCGKTRLLEVLELLVPNPWKTDRCSVAVLSRKIHRESPVLLLDESDAAFSGNREYAEAIRGILNSGHRRGGKISLCKSQGNNITYEDFRTFSPKVIAGIGELPDTVADRSIPIRLQRAIPGEVQRFRRRDIEDAASQLREDLATWAKAHIEQLRESNPLIPTELNDRQQDGAEPLLAIADAVGGQWPEKARAALIRILTSSEASDDSRGVRLLKDIHDIFEAIPCGRIRSKNLAAKLSQIESSPWAGLDVHRLARLLREFRIGPHTIRTGKRTFKGYLKQDFEVTWQRYSYK